jgi:hypothetical protein
VNSRDLLIDYGFCAENNSYDSVLLRMWKPSFNQRSGKVTVQDLQEEVFKSELSSANLGDVTQLFKIKYNKLNEEIFTYYRKLITPEDVPDLQEGLGILRATPANERVELVILDRILELYKSLSQYFTTSIEEDDILISQQLPIRKRYAVSKI